MSPPEISVVIPTYRRERVLIDTIVQVAALAPQPEIVIVDQTPAHLPETESALSRLAGKGVIRHIRLSAPSIPAAMNRGLVEARAPLVLFLDDDIVAEPELLEAHIHAQARSRQLTAGRVVQPWEEGVSFPADARFCFAQRHAAEIDEFMGGNFSLLKADALAVGGFDENFVKVAYRFEAEFAYRWRRAGGVIRFDPQATIHHLKVSDGGTRSFGEHLTTIKPSHSVGAYYYLLRTWRGAATAKDIFIRPFQAVKTRFHLRRPGRIPITLVSELLGLGWAFYLAVRGPAYVRKTDDV